MNKKAAAKETSSESESKPTSDSQPPAPESTATTNTTTTTKSNETNKSSAANKSAKKTQETPSLNSNSSTSGSPSTNEQTSSQLVAPHQHQLAHHPQPYLNYYPYPNVPLDVNTAASWPQAMAAATMAMATACGNADPLAVAAYMNYPPPDLAAVQYQDQFTYGFTPAYSFGYNTADYAPVSGATPNPTLWTPAAAAATFVPSTTSPLNQAKPAGDAVSSSTSTSSSVPVQQDPLLIAQHMNDLSAQQISPVYAPQSTYKQHYHQHNGNGHHHYRNSYNSDVSYMNRLAAQQQSLVPAALPLQYYHYNNNPKQNGYYDEFSSFQYDGQSSGAKMSNYKRSAKNKSNYSAKQNAGHAQSTTNEYKNSNTNEFVNTELVNSEEMSNGSAGSGALAKSDSKTWASIVGVQNKSQNGPGQQQQQPNKSTSPSNSAASSSSNQQQQAEQQPTQFQSYNGNYKNAYPSRNKPFKKYSKQSFNNNNSNQEAQQYVEFNLNNGAFPPISINSSTNATESGNTNDNHTDTNEINSSNPTDNNNETKQSELFSSSNDQNDSKNFSKLTSYKKQQYNNYQKQQQRQFGSPFNPASSTNASANPKIRSKYFNNNNGTNGTDNRDNDDNSQYYYKRHQPSQPTIISFMTKNDKSILFDNNKAKTQTPAANDSAKTAATTSASSTNEPSKTTNEIVQIQTHHTNPSEYNPTEFNLAPKAARFFVIKSYSEDDVHRSIKYNIWCSTEHGNRRLDSAYLKSCEGQVPVYLFFSVNGSGHFCGMAEMTSRVDYNRKTDVWSQDKWRGCFQVRWVYVKDVPNAVLRNIKLENNENKPVTNSRDTQEIPFDKGKQVLRIFHSYEHQSSIFDDFEHYEKKLDEDTFKNSNNSEQTTATPQSETASSSVNETNNNNNNINELNKNLVKENSSQIEKKLDQLSINEANTASSTDETQTKVTSTTSSPSSSSSSSSSASSSAEEPKDELLQKQQQQQPKLVATSS